MGRVFGARSPALIVPAGSAIFLDRDGVIVEEVDYLAQPRDLRMIAGSAAGGCALQSIGNIGHPGF